MPSPPPALTSACLGLLPRADFARAFHDCRVELALDHTLLEDLTDQYGPVFGSLLDYTPDQRDHHLELMQVILALGWQSSLAPAADTTHILYDLYAALSHTFKPARTLLDYALAPHQRPRYEFIDRFVTATHPVPAFRSSFTGTGQTTFTVADLLTRWRQTLLRHFHPIVSALLCDPTTAPALLDSRPLPPLDSSAPPLAHRLQYGRLPAQKLLADEPAGTFLAQWGTRPAANSAASERHLLDLFGLFLVEHIARERVDRQAFCPQLAQRLASSTVPRLPPAYQAVHAALATAVGMPMSVPRDRLVEGEVPRLGGGHIAHLPAAGLGRVGL